MVNIQTLPGGGSGGSSTSDGNVASLRELLDFGTTQPTIETIDGAVEFEPPVATKIDLILPFNTQSDQSLCGTTRINTNGDLNYRATIDGVLFHRHLESIARLRQNANEDGEVRFLSDMTIELGTAIVSFDRIQITRKQQLNNRQVAFEGEIIEEPIYEFQFQSKETENGEE